MPPANAGSRDMKIDTGVMFQRLSDVPAVAQRAEATGFDGLWTAETSHDPFLPLTLAAEHTTRIELGTAIAVAFPRSPLVLAQTAWDLAAQSNGRFILGLGTQVKAHIERRFGATWESPGPKLRELILALRAIWDCWQNGTRLNFRGRFYKLTLMTPFFNPGPIEHPHIPIYIAGVNPYLCRLAGQRRRRLPRTPVPFAPLPARAHPAEHRGRAGRERAHAPGHSTGQLGLCRHRIERDNDCAGETGRS